MRILSYLISSSLIHRNDFFSQCSLSRFRALEWVSTLKSEGLYVLRRLSLFSCEKKENIFCQKAQTLIGKIQRYKVHPKKHKNKIKSQDNKLSQLFEIKSFVSEKVFSESALLRLVLHKVKEKTKKKFSFFLLIHCLLPVIFFNTPAISKTCQGRFVNPLTDICWSCLFPISIGAINVSGGGREDIPNPPQIPCWCPRPPIPLVPGVPVGFWEPVRLVDVTRVPFCMVNMGGLQLGNSTIGYGIHGAKESSQAQHSFYQVHWYVYPVIYWLELIKDFLCMERQDFDVTYLTELDPLWNEDELSFILNPEAVLFGNQLAQAACAADCAAATAGFPLDGFFWCGGCQGSLYPFTGNNAAHNGGVQASLLMVQRMIAKLHRELLLWGTSGQEAQCEKIILPIIKKSQYKTQMTYPRPMTRGPMACNPLGRTEVIWGSGREFPYKGEDFGYLIWRKVNCCIL